MRIYEAGVPRRQALIVEMPFRESVSTEVCDEDVSLVNEGCKNLLPCLLIEVDGD
jgi:hypothetical protein